MDTSNLISSQVLQEQVLTLIKTQYPLFVTFTAVLCIIFLLLGIVIGKAIQKIKAKDIIQKEREDSVSKSRAVLGGMFQEQLSPYFPNFPCNPSDAKFIGRPIDFIAFTGSAEGGDIDEILLIEVKTGKSSLSKREKQIKKAVKEGRVRYVEYRMPSL